jgi:hypothetical protein
MKEIAKEGINNFTIFFGNYTLFCEIIDLDII